MVEIRQDLFNHRVETCCLRLSSEGWVLFIVPQRPFGQFVVCASSLSHSPDDCGTTSVKCLQEASWTLLSFCGLARAIQPPPLPQDQLVRST